MTGVYVCACLVLLALALLITAKAVREVWTLPRRETPQETVSDGENEREQRKAEQRRRELANFMSYDGREQEGQEEQ